MSDVRLVVQADDFGMCHAVNEGIVAAFVEGIVTQATVMAPCPWFDEAARLAERHAIPCGTHLTLTCEWDNLRWRPLTTGGSLTERDGTLRRTVADVMANVDRAEALSEVDAQVERFERRLGRPIHLDPHMGGVPKSVVAAACTAHGIPFLYPIGSATHRFDSITMVSDQPVEDKAAWLVERIGSLPEGIHLFCTHPAIDGPELRSIAEPGAHNEAWAATYRRSDLEALCSPEVRHAVERRGVELTTVAS